METEENNQLKEMFSQSKLELVNPGFDRGVMALIIGEEKKRKVRKMMKFFLAMILIEMIVFWMLWSYPVAVHETVQLILWPVQFMSNLTGVGEWVLANYYFILPLLVLASLKAILESRFRHSNS